MVTPGSTAPCGSVRVPVSDACSPTWAAELGTETASASESLPPRESVSRITDPPPSECDRSCRAGGGYRASGRSVEMSRRLSRLQRRQARTSPADFRQEKRADLPISASPAWRRSVARRPTPHRARNVTSAREGSANLAMPPPALHGHPPSFGRRLPGRHLARAQHRRTRIELVFPDTSVCWCGRSPAPGTAGRLPQAPAPMRQESSDT